MNLYKYEKKKLEKAFDFNYQEPQIIIEEKYDRITLWNSGRSLYKIVQNLVNTSTLANLLIPSALILVGLVFIYLQILPTIQKQFFKGGSTLLQGTISPVEGEYIDATKFISNPAGIRDLTINALKANILQDDSVSRNYVGTFYITIPSIQINRIPVVANVDSTSEETYTSILHTSLAHFKNTGLPISDVDNNIVIYGHSASTSYNPSPADPEVAFSFLQNLKVGDDIIIDMEGQSYHYKLQRSKIVQPEDVSIITGTRGKRTLTLFTCYPSGSSAYRYVAIARPVD